MKDEEIKLPPVPSLVTETDWHQAFINYGREAVRLNQPQSEPIPFNLEAAKRGEPLVTRDGRNARFVAYTPEATHFKVIAFVEGDDQSETFTDEGKMLAGSDSVNVYDLFMNPKPMRTAYVCVHRSGKLEIFDDANTAGQHGGQYGISIFEVQIPDLR